MANPPAPQERTVSFGVEDMDRRANGGAVAPGPHGGFVVTKVEKFSSAAKAGIQGGDEVVTFNAKKVTAASEALAIAQTVGIGGSVVVEFFRGGARQQVTMKLFEKKSVKFDLGEVDQVLERKIAPA